MGKKLFEEGDKVQVTLDGKDKTASIVQYDVQAKKVIVKFDGDKGKLIFVIKPTYVYLYLYIIMHNSHFPLLDFDPAWLPVKSVLKLDKDNKPIKRDRSTSRGRNPSQTNKKSAAAPSSPSKISSRTRSKSRDRSVQPIKKPGAAGDARLNPPKVSGVSADFSSADEEALEGDGPVGTASASRGRPSKRKASTPAKKTTAKQKSKSKSPEKSLKDPEFSADDEPEDVDAKNDFVNNLIEENSKAEKEKDPAAAAEKSAEAKSEKPACSLSSLFQNCNCSITTFLTCCSNAAVKGAQTTYAHIKTAMAFIILILKLILNNLPMVASWYVANVLILFMIDKKNVKISQFYRENFALPDLRDYMKIEWTWFSTDLDVWMLRLSLGVYLPV